MQNQLITLKSALLNFTSCRVSDDSSHNLYTLWVKKLCQPNHGYNFVNSWSICKFFPFCKERQISNKKSILVYPPNLKYVAALPRETQKHLHGYIPGDIINTANDQWRKHLQGCVHANGGHFEHLLEQTHANNLHIHVFLVPVASAQGVRFLLYWCLMVDRPTLLNCKAFNLLRTVNEQTVKCWFLHSVNLI